MDRWLETKQLDQEKRFKTGVKQRFDGENRRITTSINGQMGKTNSLFCFFEQKRDVFFFVFRRMSPDIRRTKGTTKRIV